MKIDQFRRLLFFILAIASIVCLIVIFVCQSFISALNIPTFHLDGAFQTASGLFRVDSGQYPGKDFFPYLGIGPLLLLFPLFKIAGGTLSASVFAAKFITICLGWLGISVLWQLVFRPKFAISSLLGGAIVLLATDYFVSHTTTFSYVFEPGNSLRPIRSAIPYIVSIAFYFLFRNNQYGNIRALLLGVIIGVSLLWSNDFAIPTSGLFLIFFIVLVYFKNNSTWIRNATTSGVTSIITWGALLYLLTSGHPFELIRFNFIDVAGDQWWYYSPYSPEKRVFSIWQIYKIFSLENYFPLFILLITLLISAITKKVEDFLIFLIGFTLFSGGVLASVGGHLGGYFGAFTYWGAIVFILMCLKGIEKLSYNFLKNREQYLRLGLNWIIIPVFIIIIFGASERFYNYQNNVVNTKNDPEKFFIPEFGGYLGLEWKSYIDYARQHKNAHSVEEYWGLWSSLNRSFAPWPVDSAIHALGNVRQDAKEALSNADVIISTRNSFSAWQQWSLSQNFWFYENLLSNWVPSFISPSTIVWKKSDSLREESWIKCTVSEFQDGFSLDAQEVGLYKVTLNYSTSKSGRYLIMAKNNISNTDGYVSLPLNEKTITIPTLINIRSGNFFEIKIVGGDDVELNIESCVAKKIPHISDEVIQFYFDDFFLTDNNWINGISRHWAGFFIANTSKNISQYKIGTTVVFKDGSERQVIDVTHDEKYINVRVTGDVLDYKSVGIPSEFQPFTRVEQ